MRLPNRLSTGLGPPAPRQATLSDAKTEPRFALRAPDTHLERLCFPSFEDGQTPRVVRISHTFPTNRIQALAARRRKEVLAGTGVLDCQNAAVHCTSPDPYIIVVVVAVDIF